MAALIREFDWASTPLGPLEDWPQSLKTTTGLMLGSPIAMVLLWGPQGVLVYNDAYARFADRKHPEILGKPVREAWPEIADFNSDIYARVLDGETLSLRDQLLVLSRSGEPEHVYLDLDYSPVPDESGRPAGELVIVVETTQRREARLRQAEERQRLEAMFEAAPSFMALLDGPEHVFTLANTAYHRLIGGREVVGLPLAEALPEIAEQGFLELLDQVMATGETVAMSAAPVELATGPGGRTETHYLDFVYQPLRNAEGAVTGVFVEGYDVTRMVAEQARARALLGFNEQIAESREVGEAAEIAARTLADRLGGTRAGYGRVDLATEVITYEREWLSDGVNPPGRQARLRTFGDFVDDLRAGRPVLVPDVSTDARTQGDPQAYADRGVRAFVALPIMERGELSAIMSAVSPEVRDWPDEDLSFLREVAERARITIERLRTEEALRQRQSRLSFLDTLSRAAVEARSAEEILAIITEMTARHLGASNCAYADMDEDQDGFTIRGDWAPDGSPHITGHYSLATFGELAVQELSAGRPLVVNDNRCELPAAAAASFQAIGISATVCLPLVREGRLVALMAVHQQAPHVWTEEEVRLIGEVTERSWAHIQRMAAEVALRDSEQRYKTLFDSIDEGFCVIEFLDGPHGPMSDYIHVEANPAYLTHTGIPNVVGQKVREMVPDEADGWVELYRKVLVTGEPMRFSKPLEINQRRLDVFTFRVEPPERRQVAVLFRDVTERHAAETALMEEKRALEILNEAGAVVAADTDLESLVQRVVDAGVALTGAEFGAFFYNVVVENDEAYMLYALAGAPAEAFSSFPMPRITEVFAPTFNGEGIVRSDDITADPRYGRNDPLGGMPEGHLPVRSYLAVPVKSRDGSVLGGLLFGHGEVGRFGEEAERGLTGLAGQAATAIDNARLFKEAQTEIARRTAAEADLQSLNAGLEARVEAEVGQRLQAEQALHQSQKMETVGQLTGGVAHDFNNLLTPIVGALDMLQRRPGNDERSTRLIEGALTAADRAKTLVHRLLAFSRRQHLEPRAVDVGAVLETLRDLMARSLGPGISLVIDAAPGLPPAHVDPNQLELALLNLAVNGRDAMGEDGVLTISARRIDCGAKPCIELRVTDTGAGMDAETLRRAVEPFFTTKEVGRGTGLGLSSVKGLAEQSGGQFNLESEPGRGTTATLCLPVSGQVAEPAAETVPGVAPDGGKAVVLLVDDEPGVRMGAADMLTDAGYTVIEAAGPEEALAEIDGGLRPDLMITDYAMPVMSGARLAAAARERLEDLPILLTTGYASMREGDVEGLPRLAKPFRQGELVAAARAVLRR